MAIRLGPCHCNTTDRPCPATLVFDDKGAEMRTHRLGPEPSDEIGPAAWREGHDEANRFARKFAVCKRRRAPTSGTPTVATIPDTKSRRFIEIACVALTEPSKEGSNRNAARQGRRLVSIRRVCIQPNNRDAHHVIPGLDARSRA